MPQHVIETVTFKLAGDTDRAAFVSSANEMGAWVKSRPGFIRRRLSCTEDGTWIEHIEWSNMDAAKDAAALIGKELGNSEFLRAIDGPTVTMSHSLLEVSLD